MKFKELDSKMRVFEEAHDHCVLPGLFMAARIDGRNFTTLTKETLSLDKPFDVRFHDWMLDTTKHVMDCGFRTIYAYTQSDEISMLLHPDETTFNRKLRKLDSILAGEASAAFTRAMCKWMDEDNWETAAFDCRISQLPSLGDVVDYFRWRQADAPRNARNQHVYWTLRSNDLSAKRADRAMRAMHYLDKVAYLRDKDIVPQELPGWQWAGTGVWWETYQKEGVDPRSGEKKMATRRRVISDEIPDGLAYGDFIQDLIVNAL